MIKVDHLDPAVSIVGEAPVGRYALHFHWSEGQGTGVYSFQHPAKAGRVT